MANRDDLDDAIRVIDDVQYAVVSDSQTVLLSPSQSLAPRWSRIDFEANNGGGDSRVDSGRQIVEFPLRTSLDPDLVAACRAHFCLSARYSRNGRDGSSWRSAMRAKSYKSSRKAGSSAMRARTAFRSSFGKARRAV
jgi:hypothetical protein